MSCCPCSSGTARGQRPTGDSPDGSSASGPRPQDSSVLVGAPAAGRRVGCACVRGMMPGGCHVPLPVINGAVRHCPVLCRTQGPPRHTQGCPCSLPSDTGFGLKQQRLHSDQFPVLSSGTGKSRENKAQRAQGPAGTGGV